MLTLLSNAVRKPAAWEGFDHTVLQATAEGCWVVDAGLMTLFVNPALCTMLGYREGELLGTHLLSYVAAESRGVLERQVALRGVVSDRSYDVTLLRSDGQSLHTIFTESRLDGVGEGGPGACIFVTDVTRHHDAERLRAAERERLAETVVGLTHFVNRLCQDLKDPLNAILGASQLIAADAGPASDTVAPAVMMGDSQAAGGLDALRDYAAMCGDAGRQIMRTVENLTLWSRLQLNDVAVDPRIYDLGGLLPDVLESLEPRARARNILIVNRIVGGWVLADLPALTIALTHLIDNAVRFSRPGGLVMLSASVEKGRVQIRIEDSGLGIPEDVLPTLFRVDHHHAAHGADGDLGSGLGLLIARALVERMGGSLGLVSRPGEGTVATVTLAEAVATGVR